MGFLDFLKKHPEPTQSFVVPNAPPKPEVASPISSPSVVSAPQASVQAPMQPKDWESFAPPKDIPLNAPKQDFSADLEIPLPPSQTIKTSTIEIPLPPSQSSIDEIYQKIIQPPKAVPLALPELPQLPSLASLPQSLDSQPSSTVLSTNLPDFTDDEIASMQEPSLVIAPKASAETITIQPPVPPLGKSLVDSNSYTQKIEPVVAPTTKSTAPALSITVGPPAGLASSMASSTKKLTLTPSIDESVVAIPANAIAMPKDTLKLPVGINMDPAEVVAAKFVSSDEYFVIKAELKAMRKTLRTNDDVLKDGILQHEQLDVLYKKVVADLNAFELNIMKIDNALFEE